MPTNRREDLIKLELHRTVVQHFQRDPERVLEIARENNKKIRNYYETATWGNAGIMWVDEWDKALSGDAKKFIYTCLREDELGNDLRQVSPFAGVLSDDERWAAIHRARDIRLGKDI